jgi:putative nucleotidyltransferase with HDIG domain
LLKPFEREQLLAIVSRAIENFRLRQENVAYQTKLETLVSEQTQTLRHAFAELERSYDITLEALGNALDLKDAETEGHSKRVTAFTIAISRAMELPQERIRVIARGAFLHDIGKMAIPDAILRKPGRLTPEEQSLMREHARLGYQMLRRIPFLQEASSIVYSHQERYDGSGYPRGLRGDQIPLGARIFAIADTFDAITSDRPYRAAQSMSSARREIQRHAGTQFDPEVVNVFLSISEQIWQELREEIDAQTERQRYKVARS